MIEYILCPALAHIRVITVVWERGASCCEPRVGIRGNITVTCIEYLLCGRYSLAYFACSPLFNPHSNPVKSLLLSRDEEAALETLPKVIDDKV